jgi:multimeric flavodoxin WrbA
MKTLLVVWHSRTGGSRQMAEAAARAAGGEPQTEVRMLFASEAQPADLLAADGYIFVCPENLASMSGQMKEFFDRCYYPCLERLNGRPYAAMFCAGSDGTNAERQLARICTGWRLRAIAEPLIVNVSAQTPEAILAQKHLSEAQLAPCAELGATMAAGLAMGVF